MQIQKQTNGIFKILIYISNHALLMTSEFLTSVVRKDTIAVLYFLDGLFDEWIFKDFY